MADSTASSKSSDTAGMALTTAAFGDSHERKIVLLLCALAAIHVFVFSAAFPFFNNVDEAIHFDLVLKYSHGNVPRKLEAISPESAGYLALMNSHAYLGIPGEFPGGHLPPPPWTQAPEKAQQDLAARSANWQTQENYEVSQTPLYYVLAASWWHVGQWLGFKGGGLVYWLRFLNIPLVVILVWLAYVTTQMIFPGKAFLQLGVPALLAFLPQTAFYSIGNDILSPLCFGATLLFLLKWLSSENLSAPLGAATGFAFAATYLSKITNLPLLAVAAVAVIIEIRRWLLRGKLRAMLPALITFICCAELPMIGWMIWCKSNFGDPTGSSIKTSFLGWTVKPFAQWWQHPLFTPTGLWTYLSGQIGTFWQGEFWWHHQPLILPGTTVIYTILSLSLMVVGMTALLPQFASVTSLQRQALQLSFAGFLAALGFFALLSLVYDFHDCPYPSRQYPYFTSGRLLLGALIPFLLLVVYALDYVLNCLGNAAKFFALAAVICAMLVTEIATDWPVFSNEYNWFHLP